MHMIFVVSLGDFLCIPTPNTGQLNPMFNTLAEFRLIVNRIAAWQSTDWLAAKHNFLLMIPDFMFFLDNSNVTLSRS